MKELELEIEKELEMKSGLDDALLNIASVKADASTDIKPIDGTEEVKLYPEMLRESELHSPQPVEAMQDL